MAEDSSRANEMFGQILNEAARDPAISHPVFRHNYGSFVQPGIHCNCTFARMNLNEMCAYATAQSGIVGLRIKPTPSLKMSVQENRVLCNVGSFFGIVTAGRAGAQPLPKTLSALRMMTTGDEAGRSFWGRRNNYQVARLHAVGRRGALRPRRKAGRGDSSTAESHRQPGRRRSIE